MRRLYIQFVLGIPSRCERTLQNVRSFIKSDHNCIVNQTLFGSDFLFFKEIQLVFILNCQSILTQFVGLRETVYTCM